MPTKALEGAYRRRRSVIPFLQPIQVLVVGVGGMKTLFNASGVVSPTNTGNVGGYTNGRYDAYGGGASDAIGDEHNEGCWAQPVWRDCLNE